MKRFFTLVFCLSVLLCCATSSQAFALDHKLTNHIPERYALLVFTGADTDQPLDKDEILKVVDEVFKEADVSALQYAIYNKGKKSGDGIRGFGEVFKDKDRQGVNFIDVKEKLGIEATEQEISDTGKMMENLVGANITPNELYAIYSDNEVIADEDFKGKPLVLHVKIPQVSKDALGKAHIKIPVDRHGISGVQIYLDKADPFMRHLRKGKEVMIKATVKGFIMDSVTLNGYVIHDGDAFLIDGKRVDGKGK